MRYVTCTCLVSAGRVRLDSVATCVKPPGPVTRTSPVPIVDGLIPASSENVTVIQWLGHPAVADEAAAEAVGRVGSGAGIAAAKPPIWPAAIGFPLVSSTSP